MTLIINALNISNYVMQKEDVNETPVYVDGTNTGVSKTGVAIRDRVRTRYTASFSLVPLPQSVFQSIITACEGNQAEVIYTSARSGADVTVTAQCSLSGWSYATDANGERIYTGCTITIEGN